MRIYLRKVELPDFEIFKKYANDEEVHKYNSYDIYNQAKEVGFDVFLNDKNETRYAICLEDSGEIIGDIGERVTAEPSEIKFGLTIFRKDLWNKGYGSEAISQLLEMLRARLVSTVILDVDRHNERAFHLYRKLGFVIYEEDDKKYHMRIKL